VQTTESLQRAKHRALSLCWRAFIFANSITHPAFLHRPPCRRLGWTGPAKEFLGGVSVIQQASSMKIITTRFTNLSRLSCGNERNTYIGFAGPTRPPPDVAREHPPRASAFFMFAPLAGNLATELPPTSRRCGNVFGAYIESAIRHQRSKPAGAKANKFSAWPTQADAIRASRISGASLHGVRGTDISLPACAGLGRG